MQATWTLVPELLPNCKLGNLLLRARQKAQEQGMGEAGAGGLDITSLEDSVKP